MAERHRHLCLVPGGKDRILDVLPLRLERIAFAVLGAQRHGHVLRGQRGGVGALGPDDQEVILLAVAQNRLRVRAEEIARIAVPDPRHLAARLHAGGQVVFRLDIGDGRRDIRAGTAPDVDLNLEGGVVDRLAVIGDAADAEIEDEAAVAVAAEDAPLAAAVRINECVVAGVEVEVTLAERVLERAILPFSAQGVGAQDHLLRDVAVAGQQRDDRIAAVDLAVVHVAPAQRKHGGAGVEDGRLLHLKERAVLVVDWIILALARLRVGIADGLVARACRRHEDVLEGRLAAGVAGAEDVAGNAQLRHIAGALPGLGKARCRKGARSDHHRRQQKDPFLHVL